MNSFYNSKDDFNVFDFREDLITEYERFSRSFVKINANDINRKVDLSYKEGRFWPPPLIQLNPKYEPGEWIDSLVENGTLEHECARIFRLKDVDNKFGKPLQLHRHQSDAIRVADSGESYILTTGTGSGKSLAYFIPIVNDVLRRRRNGGVNKGISAIVVYPMNALCNSQFEELNKYLRIGYTKGKEPVSFARYTGQESQEDRDYIAKNPPDILLTNFVMLELIMTRVLEIDKAVREHATGLRFLVLDELHTYRGRQGADVAMLVRRVRERFNDNLQCVGTSATMTSEGSWENRKVDVAKIAELIFGTKIDPKNVISETLKSVVDSNTNVTRATLRAAIERSLATPPPPPP